MSSRLMAKVVPRGSFRSLSTLSLLLTRNHSSSSSSSSTTSPLSPSSPYFSPSSLQQLTRHLSSMENRSQAEDAEKDQQRDNILPHILNLYGPSATPKDFEIYAPNATFEDPLMSAHGIKQIKSAFYSIPKIFSESRIVDYSVKENVISPAKKEILIDNKQYYKLFGKEIDMISLIKLQVEDGKVVRHEDWWDKKPLLNRETAKIAIFGRFVEYSRRGSMMATHALMRFGKDPVP